MVLGTLLVDLKVGVPAMASCFVVNDALQEGDRFRGIGVTPFLGDDHDLAVAGGCGGVG